jgi:hypothetical protein
MGKEKYLKAKGDLDERRLHNGFQKVAIGRHGERSIETLPSIPPRQQCHEHETHRGIDKLCPIGTKLR